jgi:hypothetical protein
MGKFLEGIGFLAICFVIVYGYQKLLEDYDSKRPVSPGDEKARPAAKARLSGVRRRIRR